MAKVKFSKEFFSEFQKDPFSTAEKYGFKDLLNDPSFSSKDFKSIKFEEFENMLKKSRFAGFFEFKSF